MIPAPDKQGCQLFKKILPLLLFPWRISAAVTHRDGSKQQCQSATNNTG